MQGKGKEVLFDAHCADITQKCVVDEEHQATNESRRCVRFARELKQS